MKIFFVVFVIILVNNGFCINPRQHTNTTIKDTNTFEYFTKHKIIVIPVMIHLDKAATRTLSKEYKSRTREKTKNLFQNILYNVETLFQRPNLNQTVQFNLLDVKFLKNDTKKFVMDENVSRYLNSYCRWQGEKKQKKKKWYYSVLFTGLDLYYIGKNNMEVRSSTGRSYLNGICSIRRSCSVLEWKRNNIHLKLTHEFGHSLGISHDGVSRNHCRGDHYIMAAKYSRYNPPKTWSPCSKRDLQQFLVSNMAWCVRPESRNRI